MTWLLCIQIRRAPGRVNKEFQCISLTSNKIPFNFTVPGKILNVPDFSRRVGNLADSQNFSISPCTYLICLSTHEILSIPSLCLFPPLFFLFLTELHHSCRRGRIFARGPAFFNDLANLSYNLSWGRWGKRFLREVTGVKHVVHSGAMFTVVQQLIMSAGLWWHTNTFGKYCQKSLSLEK